MGSWEGSSVGIHSTRSVMFIAVLFGLLAIGISAGASTIAQSPAPRSATENEYKELLQLYRAYERAFFDATVHGDPTYFVPFLYNDPEVKLDPILTTLIVQYQDQVDIVLAESREAGPVGTGDGILSARIALVEKLNQGAVAWEAEEERATAAGDNPSIANLPEGVTPYQRPVESEWIDDVPVQLINVKVGGDHATAEVVFVNEDQLAEYLDQENPYIVHFTYARVDGRWYISNYYATGNP